MSETGAAARGGWLDLMRGGRGVFTVLLNLAVILHGVNTFVLSTVMPSVIADVGGAAYYAWPAMMYLIGTIVGAASGTPVRAALGRRHGYVASGFVFVAGSAVAALAPSMAFLLAGQLLQGFGGGLLLSQSMALVREIYDGPLRGRILALINATWVAAAMIGPAEAGFFAAVEWWRGAFWVAVPFALLVCALGWRYVPPSGEPGTRAGFPVRRLALVAAGVLCVAAAGQIESIPGGHRAGDRRLRAGLGHDAAGRGVGQRALPAPRAVAADRCRRGLLDVHDARLHADRAGGVPAAAAGGAARRAGALGRLLQHG